MSKKAKIIILSIVSVLLVAVLTLVIIEEVNKRKLIISNHTDKNITSLTVMFETDESSEELARLYEGELKSGATYTGTFSTMDFRYVPADVGLLVTFEGQDEIFVYDGFFNERFDGTIDIDFHQADGKYWVRMKAYTGIFKNSSNTDMKDDDFYFDFEDGDFYMEGDEDFMDDWTMDEEDDFDPEDWADDEYDEYDEPDEYDDLFDEDSY